MFAGGKLAPTFIAQARRRDRRRARVSSGRSCDSAQFPDRRGDGRRSGHPFSGEKLSPVLALYRADGFRRGRRACRAAAALPGRRSLGRAAHAVSRSARWSSGLTLPVCRVIVNQAHCFATGGSFDNALPFSLSMGCGTWGGNSISDNLNYRHFLNITRVVHPLAARSRPRADRRRVFCRAYRRKYVSLTRAWRMRYDPAR